MIFFNFSTLAGPHREFSQRPPIKEGTRLWHDLFETHLGRLGLVVDTCEDTFLLENWLKVNRIKAALYEVLDTTDPKIKSEKVHLLGDSIGSVDWYIDTCPYTIKETIDRGLPSLLMGISHKVRPEWHVEISPRPWDELAAEIEDQKRVEAEREWGDPVL